MIFIHCCLEKTGKRFDTKTLKQHPDRPREALNKKNNLVISGVPIAFGIVLWCKKIESKAPIIMYCYYAQSLIISLHMDNFTTDSSEL